MNNFAQNIRYIRKINKLTQKEMAKKLGKAPTSVASWEQGVRKPTVKDTVLICKVFGIDIGNLLDADLSLSYSSTNNSFYEVTELYQKLDSTQ